MKYLLSFELMVPIGNESFLSGFFEGSLFILSLVLENLIMMCIYVGFFRFIIWGFTQLFGSISFYLSPPNWKVFSHYYFTYSFSTSLFFSLLGSNHRNIESFFFIIALRKCFFFCVCVVKKPVIYLFIFLFVVDFVIHWNETAMGLHVFPIPIPPPTSLSTVSL